jgi:hypothetical protein
MIRSDFRRRRTAEKFLGTAFRWMSRWMRMGRTPAASPKRKRGFEKTKFISDECQIHEIEKIRILQNPSFRQKPESSLIKYILDPGLRRGDE